MATIYYCKVCDKLLVDEDDLPTVGTYCSKKCEKLAEKFGVEVARKEFKKKDERPASVPNSESKDLPAEFPGNPPPPPLRKKKSTINDDNNNNNSTPRSKIFSFFGGGSKHDNSEDSSSDDSKKKKRDGRSHSSDKSNNDYDDSLGYFRKRSEVPASSIKRDDTRIESQSSNRKPKKELRPYSIPTPPASNTNNIEPRPNSIATPSNTINTNTPSPHITTVETTPPSVANPMINQPLYPQDTQSPLENFEELLHINDEPPPSYDTLFPDQTEAKDKTAPELPPRNSEKKIRIFTKDG